MTTNRLPYETRAGSISEADTFAQLMEHLRMAEEACYTLGHLAKMQSDDLKGQGWLAIGEMFKLSQINVTNIATGSMRKKGGFR